MQPILPTTPTSLPVKQINQLPDFDISPLSIVPGLEMLLAEGRALLESMEKITTPSWGTVVEPIDSLMHRMEAYWSPIGHLNAVMKTAAFQEEHDKAEQLSTAFATEFMQNETLYQLFTALTLTAEYGAYSSAMKKSIENYLRNVKLSGIGLPELDRKRFAQISLRLTELSSTFENNVLEAMGEWQKHVITDAEVSGIPEDILANARTSAEKEGKTGWLLRLDPPTFSAVLQFADDANLRALFHRAWGTRASELGQNPKFDNTQNIEQILALQHEKARLIDPKRFANYADLSVVTKMAESADAVLRFLLDLNARIHAPAHKEFEELKEFARVEYGVLTLNPWDTSYFAEKMSEKKYAVSEKEIKKYFPLERVLAGMFGVIEETFGISVTPRHDVKTWHPDVRFYELYDSQGALRGQFYLDPYARSGTKRGGAWMDVCVSRMRTKDGSTHVPVAYLTCNSTQPSGDKDGLLTHGEVTTLFHEFGHGLHHMLTLVDVLDVSGIAGVEWDAVELPSQFMENFCWEWEVLSKMTSHVDSGVPMPREMFDKMISAKNFLSAMACARQLEFSLFDFRLYKEYDPVKGACVAEILADVRKNVRIVPTTDYGREACSFTHIFSGGYSAGYYSYKWAEVLSADAWSCFEEDGINRTTGEAFMHEILEVGGSRPMAESFRAFRGRNPNIQALLRHSGLLAN